MEYLILLLGSAISLGLGGFIIFLFWRLGIYLRTHAKFFFFIYVIFWAALGCFAATIVSFLAYDSIQTRKRIEKEEQFIRYLTTYNPTSKETLLKSIDWYEEQRKINFDSKYTIQEARKSFLIYDQALKTAETLDINQFSATGMIENALDYQKYKRELNHQDLVNLATAEKNEHSSDGRDLSALLYKNENNQANKK